MGKVLGAITLVFVALAACHRKDPEGANVQAMIDGATGCPAPAICARRIPASAVDVTVCAPDLDPQSYVVGDIVVTTEMKNHDEVGRIVAHRGTVYDVWFADGTTFERTPDRIIGRVCR